MRKRCEKNKPTCRRKIEMRLRIVEVITGIVSGVIALVAVVLSIISLNQSKEIIDYQITQEQMPKVVVLNDEIASNFEKRYDGDIYNYELIKDICIPVYNIGTGIAQNCKINWDKNSIIMAVDEARNNLDTYVSFIEYDYSKDGYPNSSIYDYIIEYENNEIENIKFYEPSSRQFHEFDFELSSIDTSYILPITEDNNKVLIEIPKPISIMLLEYANHNVSNSIRINLEIMYQDITGNTHKETFCVEFLVKYVNEVENEELFGNSTVMCKYDVVVSKV